LVGLLGLLAVVAGTVSVDGQRGRNLRPPGDVGISVLQAVPDSVQLLIAWSAPQQGAGSVTGYSVDIRANPPGWVRSSLTTYLADSLWVPRDTVPVVALISVAARAGSLVGPSRDTTFTIPAGIVLGAPGAIQIQVISGTGFVPDSTGLIGLPRDSAGDLTLDVGDTGRLAVVAWTDDPGATIMVTCGRDPSGETGWMQVVPTFDGAWIKPAQPGVMSVDPDCGFAVAWDNHDPAILDWLPPTGPYQFGPATRTLALELTQFVNWWGVRVHLTDTSGVAVASRIVTVEISGGTWRDGSMQARTLLTDASGVLTPGDVSPGTTVRVTADEALAVERKASASPVPAPGVRA
jgi:hypothetical protein